MTLDLRARRRAALIAAVVLVLVAVGAVVAFGITPYPSPPTLAERPDPRVSARLAFVRFGSREPCLHVVDGAGAGRGLGCGDPYGGDLEWVDDRRLALRSYSSSAHHVIDVETGTVTGEVPTATATEPATETELPEAPLHPTTADGRQVRTGAAAQRVWVEVVAPGGAVSRALELDAPHDYELYDARWSADGRWIAVLDSAQRVLVVDAAGQVPVRVWADDVGQFAVH